MGAIQVISDYLSAKVVEKPKRVLEIGPGMGRSVVFFKKTFGWDDVNFHLYEGNGTKVTEGMLGQRSPQNFCGNIPELIRVLKFNNVRNYKIFDAEKLNFELDNLPGPYDIIYSFYSIGFHWALEHFEDELRMLFHADSVGFFVVPDEFRAAQKLQFFNSEIIDFIAAWPANKTSKMAVLRLR